VIGDHGMGIASETGAAIELAKRIPNAEIRAELQEKLIDVQKMTLRLQEENASLRSQLKAREDANELRRHFKLKGNAYWKDEVPHCINCMESGEVRTLVNANKYQGIASCPHCETIYREVFHKEPEPKPPVVNRSSTWIGR